MKINHIRISNILGIDQLEFSPDGFTEITGPNGAGKTSVLEAIKSVISGGHDATLLRQGADKGEVVLVLDDGTEITKRYTEKSSPVTVKQDGKKVARPTDAIKALTDLLAVNPVEFLRARKQDRVKVLLEAMPIEADAAELTELSGISVHTQPGEHGLAVIDAVRKQVYDDRTGTNRAVKEKDNTINQLRLAMPDVPKGLDTTDENGLNAKLDEATQAKDAELERVATKLEGLRDESRGRVDAIRAEAQAKIDKIKEEAAAAAQAEQEAMAETDRKAATQRERTLARFNETVAPIRETLNTIKANRSAAAKREQAAETVKQLEEELAELESDAARQTQALTDIDAYKEKLLSDLPIPGIEIKSGEIYRDGILFDRLNTAQQVDIAVEIAKLRAGTLGVCCVDGLELLDPEAFEEFRRRAEESNLQLFVSRVSGEEFAVKTNKSDQ